MENIDLYFERSESWKNELIALRKIILPTGLNETLKWKTPCYTYKQKNIVLLGKFKHRCTLSFFKGTLLGDPENILESPGPNSKHVKVINFTNTKEIELLKGTIKQYIFEAIEVENQGLTVEIKPQNLLIPSELLASFDLDADFKHAFSKLTPGKQRGYLLHFDAAKQVKTKLKRIEKVKDRIKGGFGFHDCTCGKSKRMPSCDGTHARK